MDSLGWGRRGIDHDIALGNSPAFPGSGLVGTVADPPRVTEGVVEKDEVLGDFDEHWKVLRSSSVHGTVQKDG